MNDDDAWFSAKRYGYGSGLPLRWQGWLVLALYIAALTGLMYLLRHEKMLQFLVVIPLTGLLMLVCARTTRGGWRWRWGDEE